MQCHRTTALDSLFTQLREGPTKIAVIGAGCSVATEATAEVSHYYNITQVYNYIHRLTIVCSQTAIVHGCKHSYALTSNLQQSMICGMFVAMNSVHMHHPIKQSLFYPMQCIMHVN